MLIPVHAQKSNYLDGLIITTENDTIACLIQKRNWKKQPSEIKVKSADKDTVIAPQLIKKFIVPSLQLEYISRVISPARYIDKFQEATISKKPEYDAPQTSFLKVLHSGTFSLYLYLDGLNRKHFFMEAPDNFLELYVHYYLDLGDSRRIYDEPVTVLDKQFEFVLKTLMNPCRTLFSIIENISPLEDQLVQVFKMYDKCMEPKTGE